MMQFTLTPMVKRILIINVVMWLITVMLPALQLDRHLAMYPVDSEYFRPWQYLTHIFMHATRVADQITIGHLLSNTIGLVFLGPIIEMNLGEKRFLSYYLLTGLGAAALMLAAKKIEINLLNQMIYDFEATLDYNTFYRFFVDKIGIRAYDGTEGQILFNQFMTLDEALMDNPKAPGLKEGITQYMNYFVEMKSNTSLVGASGAVYGLIAALGMMFPDRYFSIIPIKAKYLALLLAAGAFYNGMANNPGDNVAHFAHLGGALIGAILIYQWMKKR